MMTSGKRFYARGMMTRACETRHKLSFLQESPRPVYMKEPVCETPESLIKLDDWSLCNVAVEIMKVASRVTRKTHGVDNIIHFLRVTVILQVGRRNWCLLALLWTS